MANLQIELAIAAHNFLEGEDDSEAAVEGLGFSLMLFKIEGSRKNWS